MFDDETEPDQHDDDARTDNAPTRLPDRSDAKKQPADKPSKLPVPPKKKGAK